MRILAVDEAPFHELAYQRVRSRGRGVEWTSFEVRRARVDALPEALDGIFVCSDLQGAIPGEGPVPLARSWTGVGATARCAKSGRPSARRRCGWRA